MTRARPAKHPFTRTEPDAAVHPTRICSGCGRALVAQPQYDRFVCPNVALPGRHDAIPVVSTDPELADLHEPVE